MLDTSAWTRFRRDYVFRITRGQAAVADPIISKLAR